MSTKNLYYFMQEVAPRLEGTKVVTALTKMVGEEEQKTGRLPCSILSGYTPAQIVAADFFNHAYATTTNRRLAGVFTCALGVMGTVVGMLNSQSSEAALPMVGGFALCLLATMGTATFTVLGIDRHQRQRSPSGSVLQNAPAEGGVYKKATDLATAYLATGKVPKRFQFGVVARRYSLG